VNLGLRPGLLIFALSLISVPFVRPSVAAPIEEQLSARGIRDARVLQAFARVPRDVFVPVGAAERSHDDGMLPAGYAQTITQPYLLARMAELLSLKPGARVLQIGAGTGYPAAIFAELAQEVYAVEVIPELATNARLRLTREGYHNVHVKLGDGALGWREYGPYDAVVVTTIGPRVPPALVEQLVEGGVLVMAVGPPRGQQMLIRGVKKGFKLHAKEAGDVRPAAKSGRRDGEVKEDRRSRPVDDSRSDR
jgi:protein-L-isoaspartate(D-aspartate) O-methyltransferase